MLETPRVDQATDQNRVQIPYSGFSIASRALLMHVIVRIVRTVAFLAVVLPNARTPTCYARRFPPVPEQLWEYVWTGLSTLKGFGGCNDLILRRGPPAVTSQCIHFGTFFDQIRYICVAPPVCDICAVGMRAPG